MTKSELEQITTRACLAFVEATVKGVNALRPGPQNTAAQFEVDAFDDPGRAVLDGFQSLAEAVVEVYARARGIGVGEYN